MESRVVKDNIQSFADACRDVFRFYQGSNLKNPVLISIWDIDGVLCPYVGTPDDTVISGTQAIAFKATAAVSEFVGFLTGRAVESGKGTFERSGLSHLLNLMIGVHGTESDVEGLELLPDDLSKYVKDNAEKFCDHLDEAAEDALGVDHGQFFEHKSGNWTISTKGLDNDQIEELKSSLVAAGEVWVEQDGYEAVHFHQGDDVLEYSMFGPEYNKGTAMLSLIGFALEKYPGREICLFYPGDSKADEAIHALKGMKIEDLLSWEEEHGKDHPILTALRKYPKPLEEKNDMVVKDVFEKNKVYLLTAHVSKKDEIWKPKGMDLNVKTSADIIVRFKDFPKVAGAIALLFRFKTQTLGTLPESSNRL